MCGRWGGGGTGSGDKWKPARHSAGAVCLLVLLQRAARGRKWAGEVVGVVRHVGLIVEGRER